MHELKENWALVAALCALPLVRLRPVHCVNAMFAWYYPQVEDVKEERFISGVRAWKKVGGLSLVKEN